MEQQEKRTSFYAEIEANKRKSWLLMFFVTIVLFALIYVFSQVLFPGAVVIGVAFGLVFTLIYIGISYYSGDKIVLSSTGARPLEPSTPKEVMLDSIVENLSFAARIPKPKVYLVDSQEMNAFATGRDPQHASIAVTTALLNKLNREELEGVIGHELSHVSNYDVRYALFVAVMVGLIAILSEIFLRSLWHGGGRGGGDSDNKGGQAVIILIIIGVILAIFAPIVTRLVQASISRKRELLADASAAKLTRYPEGLARALEKIGGTNKGNMKVSEAVSHLFFVDPTVSALDSLMATHPPIDERVKVLRAM